MANLVTTYQNIADILSYTSSRDHLEATLSNSSFNWDNIVIEGSKHLVLPAIYCRLKAKKLTHLLPEELDTYLKEITLLNRNRNSEILSQTATLSELLKAHNIAHVFLKGTALISGNYYDDFAERMIGDIDILIPPNQLDLAFQLLKDNSYYPIEQTLGDNFFEHKHLPRLKTDKFICAVELHRKLFVSYENSELRNPDILASKQIINNVAIPSSKHLLLHNVLNYQVNDKGSLYNNISFRSAYDSITIHHKEGEILIKEANIVRKYFNLLHLFFEDIPDKYKSTNFTTRFYTYKLKHIGFYKFWNKLLKRSDFLRIVLGRIPHFIKNKAYRKALIKDRKRIISYFRSAIKGT
ncbi:nucleotidyltransferase family protein [Winogradskyella poriferorum]|mgnify:CR=1 FL=1|uniref:Nucleotidyltransferase family protein n=1 Tax=Winogradskyella poriferorum TaxID=307627 RepID=A0ABU7W1I9_9FLAO